MGGLTQDSVQWVSHVDGVELGGRQGAAHGPVGCRAKWRETKKMDSCIQTAFHGEALPHQVWGEYPEKVLGSRVTERPQVQRIS